MLSTYVFVHSALAAALAGATRRLARPRHHRPDQRGQASAEYALVLLGAAAVALLVGGWAARTDRVGRLLDAVMDRLLSRAR